MCVFVNVSVLVNVNCICETVEGFCLAWCAEDEAVVVFTHRFTWKWDNQQFAQIRAIICGKSCHADLTLLLFYKHTQHSDGNHWDDDSGFDDLAPGLQWLCQNELFLVLVWQITVHVKWSIFEEFSRSIGADGKWRATIFEENPVKLFPPSVAASSELAKSLCRFQDKAAVDYTWVSIQNFQQHPSCLILSIIHSVFSYRRNFQHTPKFCFWLRCG